MQSLVPGNVHELQRVTDYFNAHGVPTRFAPDGYLEPDARDRYFAAVTDQSLVEGIVFLEPDTGLEVPTGRDEKYLRYAELRGIVARLSNVSVLVIYQHKHRMKPQPFFEMLKERLLESADIRRVADGRHGRHRLPCDYTPVRSLRDDLRRA